MFHARLLLSSGPCQRFLNGWQENAAQEGALARTAYARDGSESAERETDIDGLQIVEARSFKLQPGWDILIIKTAARSALRMNGRLTQELSGQRTGISHHLIHRAESDDLAAVSARAGTQVDDPACTTHGFVVMLDDEERVAPSGQLSEGIEQAIVVTRMETDGRLIQHVENTAEIRSELGCEADALGLAAAERLGGAA